MMLWPPQNWRWLLWCIAVYGIAIVLSLVLALFAAGLLWILYSPTT